jgi:ATP-binding protein involved in chromosome partitioning
VDERHQPASTDVKRDTGITITYADGYVAEFDLMTLRMACACAECRGMRERGIEVWPAPTSPLPLRIDDAELHGAWGVRVAWNDGHGTGIFPFAALRDWHEAGHLGQFSD